MRKALIPFAAVGAIMSIPALAFSAADKHFAIEAAYGGWQRLGWVRSRFRRQRHRR